MENSFGFFNGMRFYVSENAVQTKSRQIKTHKKKRINKKWLKKYGIATYKIPCSFVFNNELIIHPDIYNKIKDKL